jgi:hypothetical protein
MNIIKRSVEDTPSLVVSIKSGKPEAKEASEGRDAESNSKSKEGKDIVLRIYKGQRWRIYSYPSRGNMYKGRELLINAYHQKKEVKKSAIKEFLHRIFHSKDDDFVEEVLKACRGSSFRLMRYIDKDQMHHFTDNAITNFILLILCDNKGKCRKKHELRKQFTLLCTIAEKALKAQDHNTAWIVDKALRSPVIDRVEFKRPKRFKSIVNNIHKEHGGHENLYLKHVHKIIEAHEQDIQGFIPIAPVLDMHSKKTNVYEQVLKRRGRNSWYEEGKRNAEMIREVIDFAKISLSQNTQLPLTKLYTRSTKRRSHQELFQMSDQFQKATQREKSSSI